MHILIGLAAAVALLYFWLAGHWFGRVLAFLVFAIIGYWIAGSLPRAHDPSTQIAIGLLCGVIPAWFISGIPLYLSRHRINLLLRSEPEPCSDAVTALRVIGYFALLFSPLWLLPLLFH